MNTLDTTAFALSIAGVALDKQAVEPVLLQVDGLVSYADYLLILTGTSARHVDAIAEACIARSKEQEVRPFAVEGRDSCKWVLVDLGDVVVHIFLEEQRGYYDLEGLWIDAPQVEIPGADTIEYTPRAAF